MSLFEQHYKQNILILKQEERYWLLMVKRFYPIHIDMVNTHLDNGTKFLKDIFGEVHSKKYSRDGLTPRNNSVIRTSKQAASDRECQRHLPINLTQQTIDLALIRLCTCGPSILAPTGMDWN